MDELNTTPATPEPNSADVTPAEPTPTSVAAAPEAETPKQATWQEELEKADAKTLRSHPKIAGMIGSERQRAIQEWQARQQTEEQARVRAQTEEEMLKFGEENADYLRQNYPKAYEHITGLQAQRAQREVQEAHQRAITAVAESLGRSLNDLPEWTERTDEDVQKLAAALAGKSTDEVIPAFNRFVVDYLADKRESKRRTKWQQDTLAKEREAIRQEEAAKLLKGSDAPDALKPKGAPGALDIRAMSDEEFDAYYNKRFNR